MKLVACAFAVLFVSAHLQGEWEKTVAQPLSLFRENGNEWIGYGMFFLLLAIVGLLFYRLMRLHWFFDALALVGIGGLLAGVAATPSVGVLHNLLAFLVLFSAYAYFATVFHRLHSRFVYVHLVFPVLLMYAYMSSAQLASYGFWQKSIILYYVCAVVLQDHLSADWLRTAGRSRGGYTPQRRETERRQKVYRLEE